MTMDYIHLMGSEDVSRAGSAMREAANEMRRAASEIESALQQHRIFMDEWISRFEQALEQKAQEGAE